MRKLRRPHAWTSETPGSFDAGLQPEPVSPELVLVDPELAERERARLREQARLESIVDISTLRRAVETHVPPPEFVQRGLGWRKAADFSRKRVLPAALMCSLLVNGLLVAHLVAQTGGQKSTAVPLAVRPATVIQGASGSGTIGAVLPTVIQGAIGSGTSSAVLPAGVSTSRAQVTSRAAAAVSSSARERHVSKGSVERRLISLIIAAPARRLPRAFVDPKTGLVKNNVQVVCQRDEARSFLCSIRLPMDSRRGGLHVRYRLRANGHGVFYWYGYRKRQ